MQKCRSAESRKQKSRRRLVCRVAVSSRGPATNRSERAQVKGLRPCPSALGPTPVPRAECPDVLHSASVAVCVCSQCQSDTGICIHKHTPFAAQRQACFVHAIAYTLAQVHAYIKTNSDQHKYSRTLEETPKSDIQHRECFEGLPHMYVSCLAPSGRHPKLHNEMCKLM